MFYDFEEHDEILVVPVEDTLDLNLLLSPGGIVI
jgi:hypothetical protein